MDNYLNKIKPSVNSLILQATRHRFVLLFVILGAAIGFALIRTQSYLDIPRNEQRYSDETLLIKYKKIDEETLNTFRATQNDSGISVGSQFDPNRNNPFTD